MAVAIKLAKRKHMHRGCRTSLQALRIRCEQAIAEILDKHVRDSLFYPIRHRTDYLRFLGWEERSRNWRLARD